jgi:hypothetical protein
MKFINQTKLHDPDNYIHGNCMRACFASFFEIDIDSIPYFEDMKKGDWIHEVISWLSKKGFELDTYSQDPFKQDRIIDYYFVSGDSPRGDYGHLVIYRQGVLVHDPHPDKKGIVGEPKAYWVLNKIWQS